MIKRFTLSIIILALSVACSFSATFYASTTGSNTAPYDTLAKGATSIQTAISALAADGDEVVVDDEVWVLSGTLSTSGIALQSAGSFTIRSLSGDPTTCSINTNGAATRIFSSNEATHAYTFTFSGLKFFNAATFTDNGGGALFRNTSNVLGDITFDNCDINGFTLTSNAAHASQLIRNTVAASTTTITNSNIRNISMSNTGAAAMDGAISTSGPVVLDTVDFADITKTQTINDQASNGFVYCKDVATLTNLTFDNITMTCPDGSTGNHQAFIWCSDTVETATVDGLTCVDTDNSGATLLKTGGGHVGGLILFSGPYTIINVIVEKATVTEEVTNGIGCAVTASGDPAQGTIDNVTVRNCVGQHGTAIYLSQGAGAVINRLLAHDNTAFGQAGLIAGAGGACYFGGWGDVDLNYSIMYSNSADEGGAIYNHVHNAATRAKTTNVQNCVIYNNLATGGDGGVVKSNAMLIRGLASQPHTANIFNTICWDGGVNEITATAGDDVVCTIDHSDIQGGQAAAGGVDTYTNNIALDPLFIDAFNNDFHLNGGSPCLDAGVDVGLSIDFDGNPVVIPFIGAYGFGYDLSRILSIGNIQRLSNQLDLNQHTQGLK